MAIWVAPLSRPDAMRCRCAPCTKPAAEGRSVCAIHHAVELRRKASEVEWARNHRPVVQSSEKAAFPKVRMYLDLPDVVPVIPVAFVDEVPDRCGVVLSQEIDNRARAHQRYEKWSWRKRGSSRRYEGLLR